MLKLLIQIFLLTWGKTELSLLTISCCWASIAVILAVTAAAATAAAVGMAPNPGFCGCRSTSGGVIAYNTKVTRS